MAAKKENTMKIIVDTSIKLFASYGYNATTTAMIAREAGVSEAIIFKYFNNKDNLLKEISKIAINQIVEDISIIPLTKNIEDSKNYPPKDFIRSIIRERFEFIDKNYELIKLLFIEMQYSQDLKNQTKELVYPMVTKVYNTVKEILINKSNIPEAKAKAAMRLVIGVIQSFLLQKYMFGSEISKDEIAREIEEVLNIIEQGIS